MRLGSAAALGARSRRIAADAERDRRVTLVLGLVERFVHDLGLLVAGGPADLDGYIAPAAAERLRAVLPTDMDGRSNVVPRFGEYAQVRIEGDLLDATSPVRSVVEFDDLSARLNAQGDATALHPGRRIRLRLLFDSSITTLLDHRVELA